MNWKATGAYILDRLTEKSTWVALGGIVTVAGWKLFPNLKWDDVAFVGMGLANAIAAGLPSTVKAENVKPTKDTP